MTDRRGPASNDVLLAARHPAEFPVFGALQLKQLEQSPIPMRLFDHETLRYLAVNDAALDLYGYTRTEFLQLTAKHTRHPDEHAVLKEAVARPTGYIKYWGGRRQIKKSGETFLADAVTQDVRFNGRPARLSITIDISERVRMQELLREREKFFTALVVHSPDIIARLDRNHRHIYVSPSVTKATGRTPEDFIGRSIGEVGMSAEWTALWESALRDAFAVGVERHLECAHKGPDGLRHYESRFIPEEQRDGRSAETVLVITRDITHRKAMEDALRMNEQQRIDQALQQRDALVREIHHRIKNHLQGIVGLLRDRAVSNPNAAEAINAAISQLQSVAAIHGLQCNLDRSDVSLRDVVEAICLSAEGLAAAPINRDFTGAGSALRLAETEAVPVAVALNELVFNAMKHDARSGGSPKVSVQMTEKPDSAEIRIRNRGRLPKHFDFDRGAGTRTGLELVRTLLGLSSGMLEFETRRDMVEVTMRLGGRLVVNHARREAALVLPKRA